MYIITNTNQWSMHSLSAKRARLISLQFRIKRSQSPPKCCPPKSSKNHEILTLHSVFFDFKHGFISDCFSQFLTNTSKKSLLINQIGGLLISSAKNLMIAVKHVSNYNYETTLMSFLETFSCPKSHTPKESKESIPPSNPFLRKFQFRWTKSNRWTRIIFLSIFPVVDQHETIKVFQLSVFCFSLS